MSDQKRRKKDKKNKKDKKDPAGIPEKFFGNNKKPLVKTTGIFLFYRYNTTK
jgi:hypothetical protein